MSDSVEQRPRRRREPSPARVNGGTAGADTATLSRAERLAAEILRQGVPAFLSPEDEGRTIRLPDGHSVTWKTYLTVEERGEVEKVWGDTEAGNHDKMARVMCLCLLDWDFTYPNGKRMPVAVDCLQHITGWWFDYLWALCNEHTKSFAPSADKLDPKSSPSSDSG